MLLICIFIIVILGIIIVKRPRTIIWMGRYIRNKLLLLLLQGIVCAFNYYKFRLRYVMTCYQNQTTIETV